MVHSSFLQFQEPNVSSKFDLRTKNARRAGGKNRSKDRPLHMQEKQEEREGDNAIALFAEIMG
jgi:hypothetical protein